MGMLITPLLTIDPLKLSMISENIMELLERQGDLLYTLWSALLRKVF